MKIGSIKKQFNNNKGIYIAGVILILVLLSSLFPLCGEKVYRYGIFQFIRLITDYSIVRLPIPLFYLFILFVMGWFIYSFRKKYDSPADIIWIPLNIAGWIIVWFFVAWGFNYTHYDSIPLDKSKHITVEELYKFSIHAADKANSSRKMVTEIDFHVDDNIIRKGVEDFCKSQSIPTLGHVQCKDVHLNGFMRRWGVAGIYFPFTFESYCDASFPSVVRSFIKAHEMAHGYGITNEGEADYFGYMALSKHTHQPELNYVADLELLRSIRSLLYRESDSLFQLLNTQLSKEVMSDLKMIKENIKQYPEFFPGVPSALNNNYLKAMGIQEGVQSYDRFVDLVWQKHSIEY